MKSIKIILLSSALFLSFNLFQFSIEKKTDAYYNSLLSIESAKKLYKKQHYEDALSKLLKVASLTKDKIIKSEAIREIAYVKYLMKYSSQVYGTFIKKALKYNINIEFSPNYNKQFIQKFKAIKRSYKPLIEKPQTFKQSITHNPEPKSINDMEIKGNLLFKMKKELSSLRETNKSQKEIIAKQNKNFIKQKKVNNRYASTINKLRAKVSSYQKLRDQDYKNQYKIIKVEKLKIEKEIIEKDKLISQLQENIKKQETQITLLNEAKTKTLDPEVKKKIKLDENLKKSNAFETLHKIWEKAII